MLLFSRAALGAAALAFVSPKADAHHEPANKLAAAGSETEVFEPGETVPILQERIRVNTSHELILQLTAECDILTDLAVGGAHGNEAGAFGQVRTWITLDGTVVPVSSDDLTDTGKIVLCNRAHEKSVQDAENDNDGTDEEQEMTDTRQANGFNWLASMSAASSTTRSRRTATTSSTSSSGPSSRMRRRTTRTPRLVSVTAR